MCYWHSERASGLFFFSLFLFVGGLYILLQQQAVCHRWWCAVSGLFLTIENEYVFITGFCMDMQNGNYYCYYYIVFAFELDVNSLIRYPAGSSED